MKIDPRHLIYFAKIIEHGGFSAAAVELGMTQPALSKMVIDMEKRIGVPLLEQRRKPVLPSALGQVLAARGHAIRAALDGAEVEAAGARYGDRGLLRVGAPSFFCESVLPNLIIKFREMNPHVNFELTTAYQSELKGLIEDRRLDLALMPSAVEQSRRPITTQVLTRLRHAIICRKGHPILSQGHIDAEALQTALWISQKTESVLFEVMTESLNRIGVCQMESIFRSDSASALMRILDGTDCLTVLPAFAAMEGIRAGRLAVVPTAPLHDIAFGVAYHSEIPLSPVARRFTEHVKTELVRILAETEALLVAA